MKREIRDYMKTLERAGIRLITFCRNYHSFSSPCLRASVVNSRVIR